MKIKKVYLGQRQIYPDDEWWQPGENTYAYYPLTANANDMSGNNRNIAISWASSYGSDGAVFISTNHNWLLIPFNITRWGTWTISVYVKLTPLSNANDSKIMDLYTSSNRISCQVNNMSNVENAGKYVYRKNNLTNYWTYAYTGWTWIHVCLTINNWTVKNYVNWTLQWTVSCSGTTTYFRFWNEYNHAADRHLYWNIKEIIIENRTRTDQEVTDYFNQTKENYWL